MSQDFSKAKIYKITNDYNNDVYVGSTCDLLTKRFSSHKLCLNNNKKNNRPIYKLMNEIGFERFRIELIEDYPCKDKYELRQREGHHIREISTLNKRIEGRTKQEYQKEYIKNNKEIISEKKKEYIKNNKEIISEKKKEYYNENKDILIEKSKEYYEDNKNKIQEYRKEKITCDCGCIIRKGDIQRHKKSNKHINIMKTLEVC